MHGIVRADSLTLAQRALEDVRPYLDSHGGGVELVGVEPPVARVRLSGACSGCSQSATTLREVVERALAAGVPGPGARPAPDLTAAGCRPGPAWEDLRDGGVTRWLPHGPDDEDAENGPGAREENRGGQVGPGTTAGQGSGGRAAGRVLGQLDFDAAGENRWTAVTADSMCWPYALSVAPDADAGAWSVLAIADSGNNRVTLWSRR